MAVERRFSTRHPEEFEVCMRYRQRWFPVARACDLSSEGIYVRTANLTLPIGTAVEIEIDRWGRQWLVSAIVAHGDTDGVGLRFQTPQPELCRYGTEVLAAPQRPLIATSEGLVIST